MHEGKTAKITVAENGFLLETNGRTYLHPCPVAAITNLCEAVGRYDIAVITQQAFERDKQKMRDMENTCSVSVARADKSEIEMLRMKVAEMEAAGREIIADNTRVVQDNIALTAKVNKLAQDYLDALKKKKGVPSTQHNVARALAKKPSPRKR